MGYGYRGQLDAARAMGPLHFPCPPGTLSNTYHLMQAGQSGLEVEGVLSTNPLFLMNQEDKLTDWGTVQVEAACDSIMLMLWDVNRSVIKYSLAEKCINTANVVTMKIILRSIIL